MKTKEEILESKSKFHVDNKLKVDSRDLVWNISPRDALYAMQEYADQETSALREELERLKESYKAAYNESENWRNTSIMEVAALKEAMKQIQSLSACVSDLEEGIKEIYNIAYGEGSSADRMLDVKDKLQSLLTSPQGDQK